MKVSVTLSGPQIVTKRSIQPTLKTNRVVVWFVNSTGWASGPFVSLYGPTRILLTAHIAAVLTKPDRIDPGDERKWLNMLRTEKSKHGWFCVRQPGFNQLQTRITPEEAMGYEYQFFNTIRPWSTAEPDLRARFGTKALYKALSQTLFDAMARRFVNSCCLSFRR